MQNKNIDKIKKIIKDIKKYNVKDIEKTFMDGYCYMFATLIHFNVQGSRIFFSKKRKHYYAEYNNHFFDIEGEKDIKITADLEEDDYNFYAYM